ARSTESAAVFRKSKHMRLLVVEDEPRISEIIKAALERAEFAVDTVRLQADAREALANTAYDAAILDLGLPDGDGLNLLAELRPAGSRTREAVCDERTRCSDEGPAAPSRSGARYHA